jgi:hypothetical protein
MHRLNNLTMHLDVNLYRPDDETRSGGGSLPNETDR